MLTMTRLRRNSRFHHAFQPKSADRADAAQMIISAAIDRKEKTAVHNGNLRRSPAPSLYGGPRHHTVLALRGRPVRGGYSNTTVFGGLRVYMPGYNQISRSLTPAE
jgi:hypothetical protein